jgi:hypothetical protein
MKGKEEEIKIASHLLRIEDDSYTLFNNVILDIRYTTSQVDHIVVSKHGIFVIETKSWRGVVTGKDTDYYWTVLLGNKTRQFYNPILQNTMHVHAVKEVLFDIGFFKCHSVIIFGNSCELKVSVESDDTYVINECDIDEFFKKCKTKCIKPDDVHKIVNCLKDEQAFGDTIKQQHVRNILESKNRRLDKVKNYECPACGGKLIRKRDSYGFYKVCKNYPKCNFRTR